MENQKLMMQRHSLAHILANAVQNLYGKDNVKLTIGPAINDGLYYDFDLTNNLTVSDLPKIENEMQNIIKKGEPFVRKILTKTEALKLFSNNSYKIELINEIPENEEIAVYYLGEEFFDLCKGPHVETANDLKGLAFKVIKVNGAYWRGNEKNKMLQRVYVYAFENKKELNVYINKIEEAKKRDHNKLGRELELFTTVDYIGQGLPIMLPKGARILQIMQRFVEDEEQKRGYLLTKTPYIAKSDLYKISQHWYHYRDDMFVLGDEEKDKEVFALRPMTCPFQFQAYLNKGRSYKDLPLRYNETSTLFRNEASGEMHGLIRVRQFTISEGHIACAPNQVQEEFKNCLELANFMLKTLGLDEDVSYRFSKWDESKKDKYIGSPTEWEKCQDFMKTILDSLSIEYYEAEGEAAFYGPKLDIQIKNVFGKEDTLITIQIDFQLAKRFNMEYTDSDGQKKNPYIIHRTSIGCYERTLALLIEKYAGAFPVWLSPIQVKVLSLSERNEDYAKQIFENLVKENIRAELDIRNEKLGYKIREALNDKIPYLIIVGDEEQNNNKITVRGRKNQSLSMIELKKFLNKIKNEIKTKELN
ncbi:MAG: threonine--tRNA ligase [Clostridia bacterium]|nr:threonine--tRNA ligase [Clostridia bacterium]